MLRFLKRPEASTILFNYSTTKQKTNPKTSDSSTQKSSEKTINSNKKLNSNLYQTKIILNDKLFLSDASPSELESQESACEHMLEYYSKESSSQFDLLEVDEPFFYAVRKPTGWFCEKNVATMNKMAWFLNEISILYYCEDTIITTIFKQGVMLTKTDF